MVSQWNVDQAAALVFTTVATAERYGVPRDRWVFPLAMVESNLVVPLSERAELHRWPAMGVCGERALDTSGRTVADIGPVDLYSCFPAAVQISAAELGMGLDRDLTLTGGMTFGGGPFDNYVLQGAVAMVERLGAGPRGVTGLTTAVSGLLTKPAVTVWSAAEPSTPFAAVDVTDAAEAVSPRIPVDPEAVGGGVVVGYTVVPGAEGSHTAVAVVDMPGSVRTVAQWALPDEVTVAALPHRGPRRRDGRRGHAGVVHPLSRAGWVRPGRHRLRRQGMPN